MSTRELDFLVTDIQAELARDPRGTRLADRLTRYARAHQDWREFAFFDAQQYTRNLVHRDELFELLLLCWNPGQVTPIHNHVGQRCWMGVLEGRVEETLFEYPSRAECALRRMRSTSHAPGAVAFITDEIALHRIAQVGDRPAVSLHLYSRPFSMCQIYDSDTGVVSDRQLGYHSIRGNLQTATRP